MRRRAILVHGGEVCLIRRQWEAGLQHSLPGGLIEEGDVPAAALRRELLEELGLDLDAARAAGASLRPGPGERASGRERAVPPAAHVVTVNPPWPPPPHGRRRRAGRPGPGAGGVAAARLGGRPPPLPGRRPVLDRAAEPAAVPVLSGPDDERLLPPPLPATGLPRGGVRRCPCW
ncbi:NUDIX domain-containing protein [Kitasatospora sp. MBT63]|uniref:NUDIX domain-containing protein n=1 Tax=Kitasatospora sp. MBT63 TaxID=1444768 RepID=UPI002100F978|nr:NUDIX domain-containing protein [Kitasatospora sp. MBT63]